MANNFNPYSQKSNYGLNQQSYGINQYQSIPTQNQPYQNYPQSTVQDIRIKGRPVTSIEEARALSIDLDGTVFYFPDISNHKIYTKQFNPDGSSSFRVYVEDVSKEINPQYVTQQELMETVANFKSMILSYIAGLGFPLNNNSNVNQNISQPLPQDNSSLANARPTENVVPSPQQQNTFNI